MSQDLPLSILSEDANTITLGWTPPAGVGGYVLYADGEPVSVATRNLKNGQPRTSARFDKELSPFAVAAVTRSELDVFDLALGRHPLAPAPTPGFDIPAFRVALQAGPGAGTNGRVGWWRQYGTDNNTWAHENDGGRTPHLATPATGQKRTLSGPRSWVWWLLGSVTIPTDFPSVGRSFATINPHNSAIDVGPSGIGGIGWGFGSGVSNVHIFYASDGYSNGTPNSFFGNVNPSPTTRYPLVQSVVKGKRYDFACEIILGRRDKELGLAGPGVPGGGIGSHPNGGEGRVRWFVDGDLVVDTGNRDTLLRATAPDGKTYTQTLMHRPWDGAYCVSGLSRDITMDRTLTRVGRTLAEALADEPPYSLRAEWGEGGGSFTNLPALSSSDFAVPDLSPQALLLAQPSAGELVDVDMWEYVEASLPYGLQ